MRRYDFSVLICGAFGCGGGSGAVVVPIDDVPDAMRETAQEKLPDVKFENAVKFKDGSYEVRGKDAKGKVRDVEFSPTGEVTEVE
ncbi:MAG TPA: hypothetical protein VGH74_09270 [Planctomycetaceae bacterium]|jgi:hypothetical protein